MANSYKLKRKTEYDTAVAENTDFQCTGIV